MTPFLLYKDVIRYDQSVPLSASVQLPRLLPKVAKRPGGTDFTRGRGSSSDPEAAEASRAGTSARSRLGRPTCVASLPQASPGAGGTRRLFTVIFTEGSGASVYAQDCFVLKHRRRGNRATKPRGTANQAERLPGRSPLPPAVTAATTAATIATVDPDSRCRHPAQGHLPINVDRPEAALTHPGEVRRFTAGRRSAPGDPASP